eukprot:763783-Hanusia_phi.AAC.6
MSEISLWGPRGGDRRMPASRPASHESVCFRTPWRPGFAAGYGSVCQASHSFGSGVVGLSLSNGAGDGPGWRD